jgi:tRNA (guanine37-N1)-methyltransferase
MHCQEINSAPSSELMSLLRPPIIRSATATLDRALWSKTIPISAARVRNVKNISKMRTGLEKSKEMIKLERLVNVRPDPDEALAAKGGKCLLLKPEVKPDGKVHLT